MLYQVKSAYRKFPELVTTIDGKAVGLNTEFRVNVKPTKLKPGYVRTIPQATQAQLKRMFDEGNPLIERIENSHNPAKQPKPEKQKKQKKDGQLH